MDGLVPNALSFTVYILINNTLRHAAAPIYIELAAVNNFAYSHSSVNTLSYYNCPTLPNTWTQELLARRLCAFNILNSGAIANNWYINNITIASASTSTFSSFNFVNWRYNYDLMSNITIDGFKLTGSGSYEQTDCGGVMMLTTGIRDLTIRNIVMTLGNVGYCHGACTNILTKPPPPFPLPPPPFSLHLYLQYFSLEAS